MTGNPAPRPPVRLPIPGVRSPARDHRWLADRARNAMRHPARISVVASLVFLVSLSVLVVVPQQQRRAAERLPVIANRVDTAVLITRAAAARAQLAAADHAVDSLRAALIELDSADVSAATARSARPGQRATARDSLTVLLAELTRSIDRAANTPLLASWRALATTRAVAADARARVLADSLIDIERRREAFGAVGGLDPAYVALTARAATIGRTIGEIAARKRGALRYQLAVASTRPSTVRSAPGGLDDVRATLDTMTALAGLDNARRTLAATDRQLGVARATNDGIMAAVVVARERAKVGTPPLASLAATVALGMALGILVSLLREMASPRLAGVAEAERVLGVRVLGSIGNADSHAGGLHATWPGTRIADEAATRIARRLLSIGDPCPRVALIGEAPDLVANVVVALATAAATDARAVLVVDMDAVNNPVSRRLRRGRGPGVTDVLTGTANWPDTLLAHVGSHSLALDVIPAGAPISRAPLTAQVEGAAAALAGYAMAWDLVLFAVTSVDRPIADVMLTHAGVDDAITCAEAGQTMLASMIAEQQALDARHVCHRGVILCTADATTYPS